MKKQYEDKETRRNRILFITALAVVFGAIIDALGGNYICVFWFGALTTVTAVVILLRVYRDYLRLGGDTSYAAPDPGE